MKVITIEYKDHEYCKKVNVTGCIHLSDDNTHCTIAGCVEPAKDFHKWLNENGYKIVKEIEEIENNK